MKASGLQHSFNIISIALNLPYNKSKLYKTLDYWSRDMLNFNFSEKGLGLVSWPHFAYNFSKKNFPFSILLTDQISLSDSFYLLRYWAICVLQLLTRLWRHKICFLIKPFWYMTKNSRQKFKYLESEKSFWGEIESIFHHF